VAAPLPDPRSTLLDNVASLLGVLNRTLQTVLTDPKVKVDDHFLSAAGALLEAADTAIKACAGGFPTDPRRILTEQTHLAVGDYDSAHHAYKALQALQALYGPRAVEAVTTIRVEGDITPEQVQAIIDDYKRNGGQHR
jgi:hypothetical protein